MKDKILLITYHPLNAINGGTIMYKSIIEKIPQNELIWIATGTDNNNTPKWMENYDKYIFPFFIFNKYWKRIFTKSILNIIHCILLYKIYPILITKKVLKIIKNNNIRIIWIEGVKHTYIIGDKIIKKTNLPIHLSINDDITGNCPNYESTIFIEKYFINMLFKAETIDFISEEMVKYYNEKYKYNKINYGIYWIGQKTEKLLDPIISKEIKKIIFYGNIHGMETLQSFCKSINNHGNISMDIYSDKDYSFLEDKFCNIFYKGYIESQKLPFLIQDYDLVYVPMSFKKSDQVISRTSISSKMILALQSQIPIIAHGPDNANNTCFVNKNNIGIIINSMDTSEIDSKIKNITYEERINYSYNAKILYSEKYNTEVNAKIFISKYLS